MGYKKTVWTFSGWINTLQEDQEPRVSDSQCKQLTAQTLDMSVTRMWIELHCKVRQKQNKEQMKEMLYLVCLFAGKLWGIERYNLNTLLLGAPQPAVLLLCPPALRPSGAPSEEEWTSPISPCSIFHEHFQRDIKPYTLTEFVSLWIITQDTSDLKQACF